MSRSMIHFELIFVKDVRSVPIFFSHTDVCLFQHHLVRNDILTVVSLPINELEYLLIYLDLL